MRVLLATVVLAACAALASAEVVVTKDGSAYVALSVTRDGGKVHLNRPESMGTVIPEAQVRQVYPVEVRQPAMEGPQQLGLRDGTNRTGALVLDARGVYIGRELVAWDQVEYLTLPRIEYSERKAPASQPTPAPGPSPEMIQRTAAWEAYERKMAAQRAAEAAANAERAAAYAAQQQQAAQQWNEAAQRTWSEFIAVREEGRAAEYQLNLLLARQEHDLRLAQAAYHQDLANAGPYLPAQRRAAHHFDRRAEQIRDRYAADISDVTGRITLLVQQQRRLKADLKGLGIDWK